MLDGLDTTGLRQVCAVRETAGGEGGADDVSVLRFYLPPGVDLDDVTYGDATDAGVSWTEVLVDDEAQTITTQDVPDDPGGGLTTVTRDDALAAVRRAGPHRTEVSWVEPYGRSDTQGSYPVSVRAVVAADPVTAVRAAVGFVNQGGTQVLRGDDGSLLLVPTSPPQAWSQALTSGVLTRSPEGCLGLDQGEYGFQLVLWPYGTTWDAAAQVLTVPGSGQHRRGEQLRLGGGGFDEGAPASDLVPAGCATNGIWIASGEPVDSGSGNP